MGLTSFSTFQALLKNGHYIKKIGFQGTNGHVNVFANRMRVARSFRGIQLDGYSDTTTLGYNAFFQVFLTHGALECYAQMIGADPFTNKNPAYQIAFYMQHSGVEWGVLTNGRLWRLYHKDTAHKQDRFYEVDLPALIEANDAEAFLYFCAFFHRAAFEPGLLSLDALLKESAAYARGVGESLKSQVYDALKELAQGFLDYPGNIMQADAATLKQIYDHSLIVLYRLLFILYAEARELLPLRESAAYRDEYSLDVIKREIGRRPVKQHADAGIARIARLEFGKGPAAGRAVLRPQGVCPIVLLARDRVVIIEHYLNSGDRVSLSSQWLCRGHAGWLLRRYSGRDHGSRLQGNCT